MIGEIKVLWIKNIIEYLQYLDETVRYNYFYKCFYGAQIRLFDNCSYKSFLEYKEYIKEKGDGKR